MPLVQHSMLGMRFSSGSLDEVRLKISELVESQHCSIVVTPNVDHIIKVSDATSAAVKNAYDDADLRICDSRILALVGRLIFRERVVACPGADLVASLIASPIESLESVLIFGPTPADFTILQKRYPKVKFVYVEAPSKLNPGSADWEESLEAVEIVQWDLGLLCISFPKQELFAQALRRRGKVKGTLMCVGASIDFLTDRQRRAPVWIQRLSLEWFYRLISSPRRLGGRYLFGVPKLIRLIYIHARA